MCIALDMAAMIEQHAESKKNKKLSDDSHNDNDDNNDDDDDNKVPVVSAKRARRTPRDRHTLHLDTEDRPQTTRRFHGTKECTLAGSTITVKNCTYS